MSLIYLLTSLFSADDTLLLLQAQKSDLLLYPPEATSETRNYEGVGSGSVETFVDVHLRAHFSVLQLLTQC